MNISILGFAHNSNANEVIEERNKKAMMVKGMSWGEDYRVTIDRARGRNTHYIYLTTDRAKALPLEVWAYWADSMPFGGKASEAMTDLGIKIITVSVNTD